MTKPLKKDVKDKRKEDRVKAGFGGERGPRRSPMKFTDDQMKKIYSDWCAGKILRELGAEYDCSLQTIWRAINRYEATLPVEKRMTKDEMKARRLKLDKERRVAATREHNGASADREPARSTSSHT